MTTVFPRRVTRARDATALASCARADVTIERITERLGRYLPDLLARHWRIPS